MDKISLNWLDLLFYFYKYNKDSSFFIEFNKQLQNEFELLTNKKFNGRTFSLLFYSLEGSKILKNSLSYTEYDSMPLRRLDAELAFYKKRMNVSVVWFDRQSKKLFKLGDDVENSAIEFHWYDFDINHPALLEVGVKNKDVRKKYGWDVPYKIMSRYYTFEDLDMTILISIRSKEKFELVKSIFKNAQQSWNESQIILDNLKIVQTGIVHNAGFEEMDDNGHAAFSIDMGSADFTFLRYLFHLLDNEQLGLKQIEIAGG